MKNRPTFGGIKSDGWDDIGAGTEDISSQIGAGSGGVTSEEDWSLNLPTFGG